MQKVCGDYPAVISFDLGEIELGGDKSLDKVPFEKIRKEIINQYNRGVVLLYAASTILPVPRSSKRSMLPLSHASSSPFI